MNGDILQVLQALIQRARFSFQDFQLYLADKGKHR